MASKKRTPKSPQRLRSKVGLGFALIILGAILIFGKPQRIIDLSQTFESEPVEVSGFSESDGNEANLPTRLIIPGLSIDLRVRPSKVVGGYWEVFLDMAGWGEGSGVPGKPGNQVIFAHAREGLFLPLKEVEEGMKIYVLSEDSLDLSTLPEDFAQAYREETGQEEVRSSNWYSYEIVEIKEVYPNQTEVIEPTDDETLTLYTCSGFNDTKRLIVVAKRV